MKGIITYLMFIGSFTLPYLDMCGLIFETVNIHQANEDATRSQIM